MDSNIETVLRWPDGPGWLILSAGPDTQDSVMDDIRATALTRISIDGGVAYVGTREGDHDDLMDMMGDLGAPTGYFVNIMLEDDVAIREALEDAGMILLTADMELESLRSGLVGAALEGLTSAFARGSVILAEGDTVRLFGAVVDEKTQGFGWLEKAVVVPNVISISESGAVRHLLETGTVQVAVGIGAGSALVLGPEARVETWGQGRVTIALGGRSE